MNHTWAAVTTVTPLRDNDRVEIDSPVPRARVRLHRDALAALIADRRAPSTATAGLQNRGLLDDPSESESPTSLKRALAAWHEHSWGCSLSYYLWSRLAEFYDDGPHADERRRLALAEMLADGPCPEPLSLKDHPRIPLPSDAQWQPPPLGATLAKRRSSLKPRGGPLTVRELSTILREGARRFTTSRRIADSAKEATDLLISYGSAIDINVLVYNCLDLEPGIYSFDPLELELAQLTAGPIGSAARAALLAHPDPVNAAATIALTADFARYQWRYRHERALRNLWVDAGRVMQDLLITATALDLETGITPAVSDSRFSELLGLGDRDHQVLHTLSVSGPPNNRPTS